MDVFWKGYYTYADLEKRWNRTSSEISSAIIKEKLIPSYFLKKHQAREVLFDLEEDKYSKRFIPKELFPDYHAPSRFVFLRQPIRTSLKEYEFQYACESPTAPMEEVPFDSWFMFDTPITSYDDEIVFVRSQVERFEQVYLPSIAPAETKSPSLYPWGDHNTQLLQKLSDVATALWSRYDPLDPSTAPTNEQVSDWLISRNVPKRTAETMATILRADGLKMGRRKI